MSGLSWPILAVGAALAAVLGALHLLDSHLRSGGGSSQGRVKGARFAKWRDLRDLQLRRPERGRLVLGRFRGRLLATQGQASVLIIGPTRIARKTTGLTVPAVLEWDGPVVTTSSKSDLLMRTIARRREMGKAMVFDPTGATEMGNTKATPLSGCGSWRGALRVAHLLSTSARTSSDGLEDSEFWHAAAEKLLAPLLFAAASSGGEMRDVTRWLNDGPEAEPAVRERLIAAESEDALGAWRANWNREERQRSSVYTTAETIVRAFEDPLVMDATSRADYTPAKLLDGGANTLYLCAPADEQARLRGLFAAMLSELVGAVWERSAKTGEPIDPPLLLVLDEGANTAPLPELDVVASTGAGQGLLLVTALQDISQAEARWGKRAASVLNNHQAKLFTPGIGDRPTLDYAREVIGEGEFRQRSETAAERGRGSATEGSTYRPLTPANVIREGALGTALLVEGRRPPAWIDLRLWFEDPELTAMVEGGGGE